MAKNDDFLDNLEGVEDDDLATSKDDVSVDDDTDEDASLEEILAKIGADGDGSELDDEEDDAAEEPEVEEPTESAKEEELDIDAIVNQRVIEEVNRIIPQRLARDRKTQQVQELEMLAGMSLEDIREQVYQNKIVDTADQMGITEEEAKKIVDQQYENAGLKAEKTNKQQQEAEVSAAMQQVKYLQDKTDYTKKPKLARILTKDILAEIDTFTQKGNVLSFEDGLKYVLGSKLATGELIEKVQAGAVNKAKATATVRAATPQSKGSGNKSEGVTLNRQEKIMAASLGVSEKEFAAEKIKEVNRKQRKAR